MPVVMVRDTRVKKSYSVAVLDKGGSLTKVIAGMADAAMAKAYAATVCEEANENEVWVLEEHHCLVWRAVRHNEAQCQDCD